MNGIRMGWVGVDWGNRGEGLEKANYWSSNEGLEMCLELYLRILRDRDHDRDLLSF